MFELVGSRFEKGEFEIRLEKLVPTWQRLFTHLGPIRGRLVALTFIVLAGVCVFSRQPGTLAAQRGWATTAEQAQSFQQIGTGIFLGIGIFVYFLTLVFRRKRVSLHFIRQDKEFRYYEDPAWAASRGEEGLFRFQDLKKFEVFSQERSPKDPYGYIHLTFSAQNQEKTFEFRLLSEDQFKIYPSNLARIMEKSPIGDWVDPDS